MIPDPSQKDGMRGRCEVMPARLLGTNLTYRYGSSDNTLFPFGYGLSYTTFQYSDLAAPSTVNTCDNITVKITVTNTGHMRASETVQAYLQWANGSSVPTADIQLVAFDKVLLSPGESATVELTVPPRQYATLHNASTTHSVYLDDAYATEKPTAPVWVAEPVVLTLSVGGQQPGQAVHAPSEVITTSVEVIGSARTVAECPGTRLAY